MNPEPPATHSDYEHALDCVHTAVKHDDHMNFPHGGHLHHPTGQGDEVEEHRLGIRARNLPDCTHGEDNGGHEIGHYYGSVCGHEAVPHGDHADYLVDGQLHHPHGDHCDDHGPVEVVQVKWL